MPLCPLQPLQRKSSGGHGVNMLLVLVIALGGAAFLGGLAWLLWALMR